jgi:prophage regulatory protein
MADPLNHQPVRLLSLKSVQEIIPVCRSTWLRWVAQGDAPARVQIGENKNGWYEHEIVEWLDSKPRGKRVGAPVPAKETLSAYYADLRASGLPRREFDAQRRKALNHVKDTAAQRVAEQ